MDRPQRDSNPCFGLERATSWASGRWGRAGGTQKFTTTAGALRRYHSLLRPWRGRRLLQHLFDPTKRRQHAARLVRQEDELFGAARDRSKGLEILLRDQVLRRARPGAERLRDHLNRL